MDDGRLPFWDHVSALRTGVLVAGGFFISTSIAIFSWGSRPLISALLADSPGGLVFLSPLGPFLFQMKVAFLGALFLSLPLLLALLARFVGAALPRGKRSFLYGLVGVSFLLALGAAAATYFYLVPVSIRVLSSFTVPGTTLMLTADSYLSFVLLQLLVSFVVLELPVVIVGLAYVRLLNPALLAGKWKQIFLVLLVALAVLTPTTDVFTLLLVTIPAFVLCITALAIARRVYNRGTSIIE
ncbi:hypothetical protein CCR97_24265 [Rhodoplanes elegans]|uniref:Sec-independent protein translocase protein TatC n=1 Tax=Rhodoplanes elegans TaxID=29408 RepID=A0A327L2K5_9BRAD|nr:twin-arginine translocase subunit TatC [Rhodoplanes elegans]MBK5961296.1 hypothetical protein [Rhodoplanes elegans]RAI41928.1 hypothetical protein CH338_01680 [Rhodoplanes elegans]